MNKKNIIITGSSRGIGAAIAYEFAKAGHNVIINCNTGTKELFAMETELKKINQNVLAVQADVSDYESCRKLYETCKETFGPAHILINNAGIASYGLFTDTQPNTWKKIMDINFTSVLNLCHLSVPDMVKEKSGSIINISSVWGIQGASCEAVYSASKGAVNTFTKALARELGPSGITVNAIACGVIDTQMNNNLNDDEKQALADEIPLMRFGTVSEAARLAFYLASEDAKYITGQIITLDGGMI